MRAGKPRLASPPLRFSTFIILHHHACPHHFAVEGRIFFVLHENGFDERVHLADIATDVCPLMPLVNNNSRGNDDSHVYVAVRSGVTLGIRAIQINLRLGLVARRYDSLVESDDVEGFVSGKRSSIHCVNSFVVLMMCWHASLLSMRAAASFCSG